MMQGVRSPKKADFVVADMLTPVKKVAEHNRDDESRPAGRVVQRGDRQERTILAVYAGEQGSIGDNHEGLEHALVEKPYDIISQSWMEKLLLPSGRHDSLQHQSCNQSDP